MGTPLRVSMKPLQLLILLILAGVGLGLYLTSRQRQEPAPALIAVEAPQHPLNTGVAPPEHFTPDAPLINPTPVDPAPGSVDSLHKQIVLLEGQIEYLQGQVSALQEENEALIRKLGSLGMKGDPKSPMDASAASRMPVDDGIPPDLVGLGLEVVQVRELRALPVATVHVPLSEIETKILHWLRQQQPGDEGPRLGRALAAIGFIPEAVDPLPLQAALLARQIGGWFDEETDTLYAAGEDSADDQSPPGLPDPVLALSFGHLMREYGKTLFPAASRGHLTSDARMARQALIAGDAGLTRFLSSLRKQQSPAGNDLPVDDPDHPFNQVPLPVFLRELTLFPASRGFEFAQALHSIGQFPQLNNAYSRPPANSAEVIDPDLYLADDPPPQPKIEFKTITVRAIDPYWDDSLGKFACATVLRAYNPDQIAAKAASGWRNDRLLAYSATGTKRDHAVWQTLWADSASAADFFNAMAQCLLQRYDAPPPKIENRPDAELQFTAGDRHLILQRNRQGAGVMVIDAASSDFASSLREVLDALPE